jgi:hypothetical protein
MELCNPRYGTGGILCIVIYHFSRPAVVTRCSATSYNNHGTSGSFTPEVQTYSVTSSLLEGKPQVALIWKCYATVFKTSTPSSN